MIENSHQMRPCVRIESPDRTWGRRGGRIVAKAKTIIIYLVVIFVLYTIITSPKRSAELVGVGFEGVSSAAQSVGDFMSELVK
ncbi:hypothetical protein [Streptomyces californicus]|uniref:hypothetical protein n=1 Tax=Streptomyces californicus TaxID=67351 RepID=UPI00141089D4|nr:hypothetical protein [Streptomyces californicus]MCC0578476.1 hypothetical protein [Streptomyces californicus]NEA08180.1 hypothetical protein [Streptomyces sp. SID10692]